MAEQYLEMTEVGGWALARAVALLAFDAPLPAVFHCMAGKDRTGVLAALVLRVLGVADSDIVLDYALSDGPMEAMKSWVAATDPASAAMMLQMPAHFWRSPARSMRVFLERFDARPRIGRGVPRRTQCWGGDDRAPASRDGHRRRRTRGPSRVVKVCL